MEKEKKKINTVVFMILATVLNIVLIAVLFIAMILILAFAKTHTGMSDDLYSTLSAVAMVASLILSFFIYRKVAMKINEKYDLSRGRDKRRE